MIVIKRKSSRVNSLQHGGTYGVITFGDEELTTMERDWIPSAEFPYGLPEESCVPTGVYSLIKAYSIKYSRDMYYLVSEDNGVHLRSDSRYDPSERWGCMFHPANWPYQLNGCVAVGSGSGMVADKYGIKDSVLSINKLTAYLDAIDEPTVTIVWD